MMVFISLRTTVDIRKDAVRHDSGWLYQREACVGMPGVPLSANGAFIPASLPDIPHHSDQKIFLKFSLLMTSALYM